MQDSSDLVKTEDEICQLCHKPVHRGRLSLWYLIKDALDNLLNLERGLLFTIWQMIVSPSSVIVSFVYGNRFRYMNPFRFLLVSATFAVLVEAVAGSPDLMAVLPSEESETNRLVLSLLTKYMNVVLLGTVPIGALGTWIVFRKPKWNYAEHLVINSYAYSVVIILSSILTLLSLPFSLSMRLDVESFGQLLNIYLIYCYIDTWKYGIVRGILLSILSIILSFVLIALSATITLFIVKLLS